MIKSDYFIIMGAKVLEGAKPSLSLYRRIESAKFLSEDSRNPKFLASGGLGLYPPEEAVVIKKTLLDLGVPSEQIITENQSLNTLDSVLNCVDMLNTFSDVNSVTVCTDRYHILRCLVLFKIFKPSVKGAWVQSGRVQLGYVKWIFYWVRDFVALFWNIPHALLLRILQKNT